MSFYYNLGQFYQAVKSGLTLTQEIKVGFRAQVINGEYLASAGTARKFCVSALPGSVTVTLAWHDYPGSPAASRALVNDLDLSVTVSGTGQTRLGNGAASADRVNNVERVFLTP